MRIAYLTLRHPHKGYLGITPDNNYGQFDVDYNNKLQKYPYAQIRNYIYYYLVD